jgi:2-oxoglutarate ferredoxin oxidoreductase subunit alpha
MAGYLDVRGDVSVVLCGAAGQGIKTVEQVLTSVLKQSGYNIFATKEFMSRIRGGVNSTSIRVSSERVRAYSDRIDILVPLSEGAVRHLEGRISEKTLVLGEEDILESEYSGDNGVVLPFTDLTKDAGGKLFANTVAAASVLALFSGDFELLKEFLEHTFGEKGEEIVDKNVKAAEKGYELGSELVEGGKVKIDVDRREDISREMLLNGTQAVALGSLAGGCNFLSFYPMTPGTGVATFMAERAADLGILVEQAEDEIGAVNMSIGAWYAGARGMVSTSGGGFALMVEGLSLSGVLETPTVIHLSQRPGPGTGLPTRTEQGDLLFALYAAHGEFPRVIYSPGSVEEAFNLSSRAFEVADRYQVPVIILTDQYLVDSYYNIPNLDLDGMKTNDHYVETDADYVRYSFTDDGVSPRGIPGLGQGLVCVDSDEHDEEGHITEDFDVRIRMVDKRLKKMEMLTREAVQPKLIGDRGYETLLIGWGSTLGAVSEAMRGLGDESISFLHFGQVYPLPEEARSFIGNAERTIVIENNATGQFAKLLRLESGLEVDERINKYNGLPFSTEELTERLEELL